jgi:hypothetical protein
VTVKSDPWFQSCTVDTHDHRLSSMTVCSWGGWDNGAISNVLRHGDLVGCSLLKTVGLQECRRITDINCNESF